MVSAYLQFRNLFQHTIITPHCDICKRKDLKKTYRCCKLVRFPMLEGISPLSPLVSKELPRMKKSVVSIIGSCIVRLERHHDTTASLGFLRPQSPPYICGANLYIKTRFLLVQIVDYWTKLEQQFIDIYLLK